MMTLEDAKLAVLAVGSFIYFVATVLKSYQREDILYDPMDEIFLHTLALTMPVLLVFFSTQFDKPIFVAMGGGMFAVLAIYYCCLFETKKRWIADIVAIVAMLIILAVGFSMVM